MLIIPNEIKKIEIRLEELRKDWRKASPAWKKVIEQNAKILKEKHKAFTDKLEKEEAQTEPFL